ncbi:hypothetical protein RKE38_00520 [Phycicoccus sp. M110.8]|nr:hypothetical protein [Phycicoccus sp. M110.8]MDU0312149.1 hypothetical protein [Phycicoccus sp. M110.8]
MAASAKAFGSCTADSRHTSASRCGQCASEFAEFPPVPMYWYQGK